MTINDKIQELLDWRGMEQKELSKRTGIPSTTINGYLKRKNSIPAESVIKFANALDVSVCTLLNQEPLLVKPIELSSEESLIIGAYRFLSEDHKKLIRHIIEYVNNDFS